jgi:hypothetical protein
MALTDWQQAALMFFAIFLPSALAWLSAGAPTDKAALLALASAAVGAAIALVKEVLGGQAPPYPAAPPASVSRSIPAA